MAIANPEMYRIYYNPSIRGEDNAKLAPALERVDRQSFAALPDHALHRIWNSEIATHDDWKLPPPDINTSSACQ
jgi:hypothetical protein